MRFRFVANDLGKATFDHKRLPRDGDVFPLERFGRTLGFRMEGSRSKDADEEPPGRPEKASTFRP